MPSCFKSSAQETCNGTKLFPRAPIQCMDCRAVRSSRREHGYVFCAHLRNIQLGRQHSAHRVQYGDGRACGSKINRIVWPQFSLCCLCGIALHRGMPLCTADFAKFIAKFPAFTIFSLCSCTAMHTWNL